MAVSQAGIALVLTHIAQGDGRDSFFAAVSQKQWSPKLLTALSHSHVLVLDEAGFVDADKKIEVADSIEHHHPGSVLC
jgi:hypothetical protein